jgi:hypothetical protein
LNFWGEGCLWGWMLFLKARLARVFREGLGSVVFGGLASWISESVGLGLRDGGFGVLARYCGVLGWPGLRLFVEFFWGAND